MLDPSCLWSDPGLTARAVHVQLLCHTLLGKDATHISNQLVQATSPGADAVVEPTVGVVAVP